jgi:hypothetical protein
MTFSIRKKIQLGICKSFNVILSINSAFFGRSWSATAELSLDQDTLWPLYTVAWSQPLTIHQKIVGIDYDDGVGILAVGGGDGTVRFGLYLCKIHWKSNQFCPCRLFTFDAENKAIIKLASIRMGSEVMPYYN